MEGQGHGPPFFIILRRFAVRVLCSMHSLPSQELAPCAVSSAPPGALSLSPLLARRPHGRPLPLLQAQFCTSRAWENGRPSQQEAQGAAWAGLLQPPPSLRRRRERRKMATAFLRPQCRGRGAGGVRRLTRCAWRLPPSPSATDAPLSPALRPCLPQFVQDGVFYAELNELLTRELAEDGYSGVEVRVTPMRTEIIIRATRTQNVLGEPFPRRRRRRRAARCRAVAAAAGTSAGSGGCAA